MPGIEVNEPLNPSAWTTEQQQEMYDALVVLLGVTPSVDYPSMTDEELSASLHECVKEMATRDTAVVEPLEGITFYDDQIIVKPEA